MKDSLTELEPRENLETLLDSIIPNQINRVTTVMLIDLEDFRGYNKKYSDLQGDIVLKTVADYLKGLETQRIVTQVFRFDKYENRLTDYFAVVIHGTDNIRERLEIVKKGLANLVFKKHPANTSLDEGYKKIGFREMTLTYRPGMKIKDTEPTGKEFLRYIYEELLKKEFKR